MHGARVPARSRHRLDQTCRRRFQTWVETGVTEQVLHALARDLRERGGLDLTECFADAAFASAKKGERALATKLDTKPSAARIARSEQSQTLLAILSSYAQAVLPDPDNGQITGGQPVPAGLHAFLRRGDAIEAWDAEAGRPLPETARHLPEARQVPGREWMDGLLSDGQLMVMWDQNMPGAVSRLPDMTAKGVRIAPKAEDERGLLWSGILYASMRDPVTGEAIFQAVDVTTGAVLGWWPLGDFSAGRWAGTDGTQVYYAGADGSVRAFRLLAGY